MLLVGRRLVVAGIGGSCLVGGSYRILAGWVREVGGGVRWGEVAMVGDMLRWL